MKTFIRNTLLNDKLQDIVIAGSKIHDIGQNLAAIPGARILNGEGTAALPSMVNAHTHSPMTLIRGSGDDFSLHEWLNLRIWPLEREFTEEDYYWGNRLAIAEMIYGGTGFFNEMYMQPRIALKALEDAPLKGMIHYPIIDGMDPKIGKSMWDDCTRFFAEVSPPKGVDLGVALHSIYSDSQESIEWVRDFTKEAGLKIHIHLSETQKEVEDCIRNNGGKTPVEYLGELGLLSDRVIAAHTVHLSDNDIEILAGFGVTVIHNPVSNMKLGSGVFPYQRLKKRNVRILLGTDGAASNNNLDMLEEMKIAALLQKVETKDATVMPAEEILNIASTAGADYFATGGGKIEIGREADIMLLDIGNPQMAPLWNLSSSLVYSANSGNVKTLISAGRILMEDGVVPGYEEVCSKAFECQRRLSGIYKDQENRGN